MATSVSKTELKAHALELLRGIQATGQPLVVTGRGRRAGSNPVIVLDTHRARSCNRIVQSVTTRSL